MLINQLIFRFYEKKKSENHIRNTVILFIETTEKRHLFERMRVMPFGVEINKIGMKNLI